MKNIFTTFCLLFSMLAYSQFTDRGVLKVLDEQWLKTNFNQDEKDVQGSPYLDKEYSYATVDGVKEKILARYNIFSDEIEFKKDGKVMIVPKSDLYTHFVFENGEKIQLIDDKYYINVYGLEDGFLYKKMKSKYQEFKKATSGYGDDKPAKFTNQTEAYYIGANNKLVEFPKNKEDFAKLFPEKNKEILDYLNKNKNKLKSEVDMVSALSYVNGLK